jgi:hypothetical protein
MNSQTQRTSSRTVIAKVSPVIGAGLTVAGWVVVANVAWQLSAGLTQALLCEARSRRPLECLPAWSQLHEIGRRSTDTLFALVVHSPADSATAAIAGMAGTVLLRQRRTKEENAQPLSGPIGIVPPPLVLHGSSTDDPDDPTDPEPA